MGVLLFIDNNWLRKLLHATSGAWVATDIVTQFVFVNFLPSLQPLLSHIELSYHCKWYLMNGLKWSCLGRVTNFHENL